MPQTIPRPLRAVHRLVSDGMSAEQGDSGLHSANGSSLSPLAARLSYARSFLPHYSTCLSSTDAYALVVRVKPSSLFCFLSFIHFSYTLMSQFQH